MLKIGSLQSLASLPIPTKMTTEKWEQHCISVILNEIQRNNFL